MGDAKPGIVMANRDRELLIPVGEDDNDATPKPSSSSSHNADVLQVDKKLGIQEVHDWMGVNYLSAEIVVSGGMSMPQVLSTLDIRSPSERSRSSRVERN
ncbi:hypothetical protein F2Q69_00053503 [Brassica cretica]|uniref:Uncharacterized protein n=1 Tax=Brassica cretica TaxID=69181 RepID=A0A8S9N246_BRACR|nr:hypothetical protein F2Q69_00053503 [Brassica cretica]